MGKADVAKLIAKVRWARSQACMRDADLFFWMKKTETLQKQGSTREARGLRPHEVESKTMRRAARVSHTTTGPTAVNVSEGF